MKSRLQNFQLTSSDHPIHILVQCAKLGEGYDQPNISVVGICCNIGKLSKFAQFIGRAVRKLRDGNVEAAAVSSISDARDNVAHVVTHERFNQLTTNWGPFTTQEGFGGFDPEHEDDEGDVEDDDAASVWSASDSITFATLAASHQAGAGSSTSTDPMPAAKKLKPSNSSRKVDRYVLTRTCQDQKVFLGSERAQHDGNPTKTYMAAWEFVDHVADQP